MALYELKEVQEIKNLEFLAKQVVEGFIVGMHKSPFHGFSVEFAEHRLYNQGESTKNIDWKVFARTDKLFTKRYDEETNLRCHVLIDASSSMYYPDGKGKINKINFSILAASGLIELLRKQRDAAGLAIFSNHVETLTKAKSSSVHINLLYDYMEKLLLNQELNKSTEAAKCLHEIAEQIPRRSLVLIFSDMMQMSNQEDIFAALQHLKHNKHEVVLFHVVDKKHEIEFDFDNRPYLFVDMEDGSEVKLHANEVKAKYMERMQQFEKELKLKCAQYKIDFVEADINLGFNQVLTPYLLKRTKML
ncbi:MAG: DUF58 domain-containing protein [Bacteroidetes bacterium]|nr:DUF58 domain-containing protein [Bacteroidota bacterium]